MNHFGNLMPNHSNGCNILIYVTNPCFENATPFYCNTLDNTFLIVQIKPNLDNMFPPTLIQNSK